MIILGVDEVGRGCWAGPLVAGAVILHEPIDNLADSKVLSKVQRELLAKSIYKLAAAVSLGWVTSKEVDEYGLTRAVRLAMERAVAAIKTDYDQLVVDGNYNYLAENPKSHALIKADAVIPAVSAASIVAKVARDKYMTELAIAFPQYGFEKHVGYGTVAHLVALKINGVSMHHRHSYKPIKALL